MDLALSDWVLNCVFPEDFIECEPLYCFALNLILSGKIILWNDVTFVIVWLFQYITFLFVESHSRLGITWLKKGNCEIFIRQESRTLNFPSTIFHSAKISYREISIRRICLTAKFHCYVIFLWRNYLATL